MAKKENPKKETNKEKDGDLKKISIEELIDLQKSEKEENAGLRRILEQIANVLQVKIYNKYNLEDVTTNLENFQTMKAEDCMAKASEESGKTYVVFSHEGARRNNVIIIDNKFANKIIDHQMRKNEEEEREELTSVGSAIIKDVADLMQESIQKFSHTNEDPSIENMLSNAQFIKIKNLPEDVIYVTFLIKNNKYEGKITMLVDANFFEKVEENIKDENDYINNVKINIEVLLWSKKMPIKEILQLKEDDIINTGRANKEDVELFTNGKKLYNGKLGCTNGKMAVRVHREDSDVNLEKIEDVT